MTATSGAAKAAGEATSGRHTRIAIVQKVSLCRYWGGGTHVFKKLQSLTTSDCDAFGPHIDPSPTMQRLMRNVKMQSAQHAAKVGLQRRSYSQSVSWLVSDPSSATTSFASRRDNRFDRRWHLRVHNPCRSSGDVSGRSRSAHGARARTGRLTHLVNRLLHSSFAIQIVRSVYVRHVMFSSEISTWMKMNSTKVHLEVMAGCVSAVIYGNSGQNQ
jgi:hypothetical protein